MSNDISLRDAISEVIEQNPKSVNDYREGNVIGLGFLLGQVMKVTDGRYNAALVQADLRDRLDTLPAPKRKRKKASK